MIDKINGEVVFTHFKGRQKILKIPETYYGEPVTAIGRNCIDKDSYVKEIILPKTIKVIQSCAFKNCISLKKIHLNEGLIKIEQCAFENCIELEELILPKSLEDIKYLSFGNCVKMKKFILNNDLKFNGDYIFKDTPLLKDVNYAGIPNFHIERQVNFIEEKLNKVDSYSEKEKTELVTFIDNQIDLKIAIFSKNLPVAISKLISLNIKLSLESIEEYLQETIENEYTQVTAILFNYQNENFSKQELADYQQKNELVEIGFEPPSFEKILAKWDITKTEEGIIIYGYKGKNKSETIPDSTIEGIPIIGVNYKQYKSYEPIEVLTVNANIEALGESVFWGNKTLREIHLPPTITKIKNSCFRNCENLEKFDIPESVTIEGNPFKGCGDFLDKDNFFIFRDILYYYNGVDACVTVPKGVKRVEAYAFESLNQLQEVKFQDDLERLENFAFQNCIGLEKVYLPKKVIYDDEFAFSGKYCSLEIIKY